ncbi:hypothetical protein KO506_11620 [Polaribacter vadi]|uniref:hypothetical protein n=1 Tax=Polaribacter TaxID=52959 RepID=UPI001C087E8A|nr:MULTISPECIES: hypothetical protein [Polaribacter]MBU3012054.1 hypothetical protein [Polaribacter vadi]MDO6741869.1 hypothetical protein [Polaribacter sp. 1_MG-2023]
MIDLKQILSSFTEEKQQDFIYYLDKKNKRKDAKNIQLVKFLIDDNFSSKEICLKLYSKENKVALHALRKRLFKSLIDYTANINLKEENSIDISLIKHIISARSFLKKGQYKVGYKILDKAELIANEYQLYTILNEIYHTKIEYVNHLKTIDIDEIILKFKENQQQHQLEERLNIAYAKITKTLNEIEHQQKIIDLKSVIETVFKENEITISNELSFKSLYQIIKITNISTIQNFEYWSIEPFLLETYETLRNHKAKDKQLFYHIEVLYVIANTLFRNKKFKQSLEYLELMYLHMHQNKKKHYKDFYLKHQLLVSLNYNYSGNQDFAIQLLTPFIDQKKLDIVSQLDIYLSLIVFYAQKKEIKKAQSLFLKFYHTDKWYIDKAGFDWTIKKNLIEILLQIDLGNIDVVDSRILSFKRNYKEYLKNIHQEKVINYLKLIETYYKNPEIVTSEEFHQKVEKSFTWLDHKKEDIFIMSFFAWLKAKMTKQNVYDVTLELINKK